MLMDIVNFQTSVSVKMQSFARVYTHSMGVSYVQRVYVVH